MVDRLQPTQVIVGDMVATSQGVGLVMKLYYLGTNASVQYVNNGPWSLFNVRSLRRATEQEVKDAGL